jgi:[ribosomal protein S5]-alanine N-acetyltransferase
VIGDSDRLPTIATPRLELRWLEARDVSALFDIFGDAETVRYWSRPPLEGLDEAASLLAEIQDSYTNGTLYQWGVALHDRVIGTCSLFAICRPHKRAELGFAINRARWGQGYASEAAGAIVRYAFEAMELHRLEADVDPRNDASIRCLERLGFRREGYARERYHLGGEIQDAVLYGLLRSDANRKAEALPPHSIAKPTRISGI